MEPPTCTYQGPCDTVPSQVSSEENKTKENEPAPPPAAPPSEMSADDSGFHGDQSSPPACAQPSPCGDVSDRQDLGVLCQTTAPM